MSVEVWQAEREWAESLGRHREVTREEVQLLLQALGFSLQRSSNGGAEQAAVPKKKQAATSTSPATAQKVNRAIFRQAAGAEGKTASTSAPERPGRSRDITPSGPGMARVVPLCTFLLAADGKAAELVIPRIVECLQFVQLGQGAFSLHKSVLKKQELVIQVMESLTRVMEMENLLLAYKMQLSLASYELVKAMLSELPLLDTGGDISQGEAHITLPLEFLDTVQKALVAHTYRWPYPRLPLLLQHSQDLVEWWLSRVLQRGEVNMNNCDPAELSLLLRLVNEVVQSGQTATLNVANMKKLAQLLIKGMYNDMSPVLMFSTWSRERSESEDSRVSGASSSSAVGSAGVKKRYAPPASYMAASCALLSMLCYLLFKETDVPNPDILVDSMQLLLQLVEGYMALAVEAASQPGVTREQGGQSVNDVYEGCCTCLIPLWRTMTLAATLNPPELLDGIERLELVVLTAAQLYGKELAHHKGGSATNGKDATTLNNWRWDMEQGIYTAQGPPTAEHVFRGLLHAWCGSMCASWQAGHQGPVLSTLVGLLDAQSLMAREQDEQKGVMLAVGCLAVALKGDEGACRLVVQFMIDLLTEEKARMQPSVYGMVIYITAVIAIQMAKHGSGTATSAEVGSVLLKLYKTPSHPVSAMLMNGGPCDGALAHAFLTIAIGLQQCNVAVRAKYRQSMLQLFCDVAMSAPASPRQPVSDSLGALLPVLAAASHDLTIDLHGIITSPSGSTQAVEQLVQADAAIIRLYRLFWLVCSIYNFSGMGKGGSAGQLWPKEWRASLGVIATRSPPLILGGAVTSQQQFDKIDERLDSDLYEPLQRLGERASHASLSAALLSVLSGTGVHAPTSLSRARIAYLLSIAHHNLCRAELAPLPDTGDLFPLAGLMASLQVMDPAAGDFPYMSAIVHQTFKKYLVRWKDTQLSTSSSYALPTQADVAEVLVNNMCSNNGNAHMTELSSSLLNQQLNEVEALRWNKQLLVALLQHLAGCYVKAGVSRGGTDVKQHVSGVLYQAAHIAPDYTASLVQEQLKATYQDVATALIVAAPLITLPKGSKSSSSHTSDGFHTVIRKSFFEGRVSGLADTLHKEGNVEPDTVVREVMEKLQRALENRAAPKVIEERYMESVCSVIMYPTAAGVNDLLHLIAWTPAIVFSKAIAHEGVFGWNWVMSVSVSTTQVNMLCEIANAWVVTVDQQKGLFDVSFDPTVFEQSTGGDPDLVFVGSDEFSGQPRKVVEGIEAHSMWLGFLQEMWEVFSRGKDAASVAVVHVFQHILQESFRDPDSLSYHPASVGLRFRLLCLALRFCNFVSQVQGQGTAPLQTCLLYERILRTALAWFAYPVTWYGRWPEQDARGEAEALKDFMHLVSAMNAWPSSGVSAHAPHPVWGKATASSQELKSLLQLLLSVEYERLCVWASPRQDTLTQDNTSTKMTTERWKTTTLTAWEVNPRIALSLASRFPCVDAIQQQLRQLMLDNAHATNLQEIPDAAVYLADAGTRLPSCPALRYLSVWSPLPLLVALDMISNEAGKNLTVREYALRSMRSVPPEQVAFFLPQLVQLLRGDQGGLIADFLVDRAKHSIVFADHLVCLLKSEGRPPEDAMNPVVKRSGWHPPSDTGLWDIADKLVERVWKEMPKDIVTYLKAQIGFFDEVTMISGKLYPVPKDQRKNEAVKLAGELAVPRPDLFIPTNPETRVVSVIPKSATPMRSAAKVPILVAFKVELKDTDGPNEKVQACIFKVGDDIRQDVLALQVIGLLKDAFQKAGLDLYLCPYGCLPTGYEQGIIECVPNATSRAEYGEIADGGLYEIYQRNFGAPGTERFEMARENFMKSEAGYAIASYLLWAKDRHGGNLMFDNQGHLIHIDFGFILGISPGGNLGFETAAFKFNHEMVQLIDPGGTKKSDLYHTFVDLCVRGFLAARSIASGIIAAVSMMSESGLPCYGYGQPIKSLRARFHLELTEVQAAQCMRTLVDNAYNKWTTGFYDWVQYKQNKIPK